MFYRQVLFAWSEVRELTNEIKDVMDIRREYIWANKNIKISNEYIVQEYQNWFRCGILQIHDILDSNGHFLDFQVLKRKYNLNDNMLKYMSLKSAIPREWKMTLRTMTVPPNAISSLELPYIKVNNSLKPISLLKNRDLYWIFVKSHVKEPVIKVKLSEQYNIKEEEWPDIFTLIFRATQEPALRCLQYKIIYKIFPCNKYLAHFINDQSNICSWCYSTVDTIEHYFCACSKINNFWKNFQTWWNDSFHDGILLGVKDIIFGTLDQGVYNGTLNACILKAKYYIYKKKVSDDYISFDLYKRFLKDHIIIERYIATRNDKLKKFNDVWMVVNQHL